MQQLETRSHEKRVCDHSHVELVVVAYLVERPAVKEICPVVGRPEELPTRAGYSSTADGDGGLRCGPCAARVCSLDAELGSAFDHATDAEVGYHFSGGVIAETLIGPIFGAVSAAADGNTRFYLGIGQVFR